MMGEPRRWKRFLLLVGLLCSIRFLTGGLSLSQHADDKGTRKAEDKHTYEACGFRKF
jgi:hypothetical protein